MLDGEDVNEVKLEKQIEDALNDPDLEFSPDESIPVTFSKS
jgi:hypothetical protein